MLYCVQNKCLKNNFDVVSSTVSIHSESKSPPHFLNQFSTEGWNYLQFFDLRFKGWNYGKVLNNALPPGLTLLTVCPKNHEPIKDQSFCHTFKWSINSFIFETQCCNPFIWTMKFVRSDNLILKYQRIIPAGCKDIGFRKF